MHEHEEKLRTESMVLIRADRELSRRLAVIQKAMTVIFGYTVDHTSRNENEVTVQLLGIRLFNAAASGMKLALSGDHQTAFQQARDIMETGFRLITSARSRSKSRFGRQPTGRHAASFLTR